MINVSNWEERKARYEQYWNRQNKTPILYLTSPSKEQTPIPNFENEYDDIRFNPAYDARLAREYFKGCIEVTYKGHTYYIEKPSLSKTTIRVRCSCKDFYFSFALWDYMQRAIVGPKPKKYTRKTPSPEQGGRAYRNPRKIPGLCKHIFNALRYLKSKGWVKP